MNEELLNNIWEVLSLDGATDSDYETWKQNFQGDEEIQVNVHKYLTEKQYTESDYETWSTNIGIKKKDNSQPTGGEEVMVSDTEVVDERGSSEPSVQINSEEEIVDPETLGEIEQIQEVPNRFGADTPKEEMFLHDDEIAIGVQPGEEDTAIEEIFGKNEFTDFFGDMWRAGAQGQAQGGTIDESLELLMKGGNASQNDIEEFLISYQAMQRAGVSDEMNSFNKIYQKDGGGILGFIKGVAANPTVVPQLFISSVSAMINPTVLAAATAGAVAGSVIPGAGTIAGGMFAAGTTLETALTFGELLEEALDGKPMTNANIRSVLEDAEKMSSIRMKALGRGLAIGAIDGLTGGLATKLTTSVAKATSKAGKTVSRLTAATAGGTLEAVGGSTGEVVGRLVAGQEMDVAEILFEGIAGTATAPITVGAGLLNAARKPPSYEMNKGPATRADIIELLESNDADAILNAEVSVENDPELNKQVEAAKKKILDKKVLNRDLKNAGVTDQNAIDEMTALEEEAESLKGNNTRAGKRRLAEINQRIDDILDTPVVEQEVEVNENTDVTEETIVSSTDKTSVLAKDIIGPNTFTHKTPNLKAILAWINGGKVLGRGEKIENFTEGKVDGAFNVDKSNSNVPNFQKGGFYGKNPTSGYVIMTNQSIENLTPNSNGVNQETFEDSRGIGILKPTEQARNINNFDIYKVNADGSLSKVNITEETTTQDVIAEMKALDNELGVVETELENTPLLEIKKRSKLKKKSDEISEKIDNLKIKQDAIQESSTESVDVQESTTDSKGVGDGNTQGNATQESIESEADTKTPAQEEVETTKSRPLKEKIKNIVDKIADAKNGVAKKWFNPLVMERAGITTDEQVKEYYIQSLENKEVINDSNKEFLNSEFKRLGIDSATIQETTTETPTQQKVTKVNETLDIVEENKPDSHYDSNLFKKENPNTDKKKHESKIMDRANKAVKAIQKILPGFKIVLHKSQESYGKITQTNSRAVFTPKTKTIHVNIPRATGKTIAHEVFHAVLKSKLGAEINLQKASKVMVQSLRRAIAKSNNLTPEQITQFEEYTKKFEGKAFQDEESLAEFIGILADNYSSLDVPQKSIVKKFIDTVAKIIGIQVDDAQYLSKSDQDVVDLLNTISEKVTEGTEIKKSDIKKLDTFEGGKFVKNPVDAIKTEKIGNFEVTYTQQEKIEEYIKDGRITQPEDLSFLEGMMTTITSPDDMMAGELKYKNKVIFQGEGGVFFVTKFGEVWASGKIGTANTIKNSLNKQIESGQKKGYLVLTKGTDSKLVSSASGVNSTLEVLNLMLDEKLISPSLFRSSVTESIKKEQAAVIKQAKAKAKKNKQKYIPIVDKPVNLRNSAKDLKADIKKFFTDPTTSTFMTRGNIVKNINSSIINGVKSMKDKEKIRAIAKFIGGDEARPVGVNTSKIVSGTQGLTDLLATLVAEKLTKGLNIGDVYAVIEVDGKVDVIPSSHPSYPFHIVQLNKKKPKLILPKNREAGKDLFKPTYGKDEKTGESLNNPYSITAVSVVDGVFEKQDTNVETDIEKFEEIFDKPKTFDYTQEEIDKALQTDKISREIIAKGLQPKEGDKVGVRLNLNVLKKTKIPIQTVHEGQVGDNYKKVNGISGFFNGTAINYAGSVTLKDVYFNAHQKRIYEIKTGEKPKNPVASVDGLYQDVSLDNTNTNGVEIKFNPMTSGLFVTVDGNKPVRSAEEATIIGNRVYARGKIEYFTNENIPEPYTPKDSVKTELMDDYSITETGNGEFTLKKGRRFAGDITLSELQTDKPSVSQVFIRQFDQGKGLSIKLYKEVAKVMRSKGKTLVSSKYTNDASQGVWKRLVKDGDAKVIGSRVDHKGKDRPYYSMIDVSEDKTQLMDSGTTVEKLMNFYRMDSEGFIKPDNVYDLNSLDEWAAKLGYRVDRSRGDRGQTTFYYLRKLSTDDKFTPTVRKYESIDTIDGYQRMMDQVAKIISKSKKRGVKFDKIPQNVLDYVTGTKVYERATDLQREAIYRDIRLGFGIKEKAAPSVKKVIGKAMSVLFGETKEIKKFTVTEKQLLIQRLKQLNEGAKTAKKSFMKASKELADAVSEMVSIGKISTKQAAAVIKRFSKVNMFNEASIERFVDYMAKVFANAEYAEQIAFARKKVKQANKNIRTKLGIATDLINPLQRLFSIDPTLIPDSVFKKYLSLVEVFGERATVLTLEQKQETLKDVQDVLDKMYEEQSQAEEMALIFADYKNKVFNDDGKLNYAETIKAMLEDGKIDEDSAAIMRKYKSDILPQIDAVEKTDEQIQEEKDEVIEEFDNIIMDSSTLPSQDERNLARRLNKLIDTVALDQLNLTQLKNLLKVVDNINNGYLPHYAQLLVEQMDSINSSEKLSEAIGKSKPLIISKFIAKVKTLLTKKRDAYLEMIRRNPLYNIDQLLGNFKGREIFDSLFSKVSEGVATYNSEYNKIQKKIEKSINDVSKSFKGNPAKVLESSFKQMAYMIQLEFQSNPDSKQVNPASEYLKKTIKAIRDGKSALYTENDAQVLEKILKDFSDEDGNISLEKLDKSFNNAEKKSIKTVREVNEYLLPVAEYTSAIIRGDKINPLTNYIHLPVMNESKPIDVTADVVRSFGESLNPSTKAKSLIERTGKVSPINFNIYSSVQKGSKMVLMDRHLTEPIRTARRTLNRTESTLETENGGTIPVEQRKVFNAIKAAFLEATDNLLQNTFTETTIADDVVNYISKQGYRSVLAGTGRFMAELTSNIGFALMVNPKAFKTGINNRGFILSAEAPSVMQNVGSKQTGRIFPGDTLSGKMVDTNILNQSTGIENGRTRGIIANKIQQIYNLSLKKYINFVELTADALISTPDKLVMRPIWFGEFANVFKTETGAEVDFNKIAANDEAYMTEYSEVIEKAKDAADETSVKTGATDNPFMDLLKGKSKPNQTAFLRAFNNFNGFMTRFLIFEYVTARTGLYAAMGNGTITKKQGIATLAGVTTRMVTYTLLTQMLGSGLIGLLFGSDEEEEKKSIGKQIGQAISSAFTSLLIGRDFGNAVKSILNQGVEMFNEEYLDFLREGEYDPYKDSIQYTIVPKKAKEDFRGTGIGDILLRLTGSFGPALKTVDLITKKSTEKVKKTPAARKRQVEEVTQRIPLEVFGHLGLIPLYKDIRKVVMKKLYKDLRDSDKKVSKKSKSISKTYDSDMFDDSSGMFSD